MSLPYRPKFLGIPLSIKFVNKAQIDKRFTINLTAIFRPVQAEPATAVAYIAAFDHFRQNIGF